MKIRILSGPGSGKSRLSKKIGQILKINAYDLDYVRYDNSKYFIKRDEKERVKLIAKLVAKKDWIMEGVYGTEWAAQTYDKADVIIILKTPRYKRIYRIIKRSIKAHFGKLNTKKDTLRQFLFFLKWNWSYEKDDLPIIISEIKPYTSRKKTLVFTSEEDALNYFKKEKK